MGPETGRSKTRLSRGGRAILKISLAVSILFHAVALMVIQKAFPLDWFEPMKIFQIELIRPPVDQFEEEAEARTDLARIKQKESKPPEETEETISLDTKDERYSSYAGVIKQRLMAKWQYPREALENLLEGKLLVLFSLNRVGQLKELKVVDSSGFPLLDGEALRTVRTAAPFPPFPGSITVSKLNIRAAFDYRLKRKN